MRSFLQVLRAVAGRLLLWLKPGGDAARPLPAVRDSRPRDSLTPGPVPGSQDERSGLFLLDPPTHEDGGLQIAQSALPENRPTAQPLPAMAAGAMAQPPICPEAPEAHINIAEMEDSANRDAETIELSTADTRDGSELRNEENDAPASMDNLPSNGTSAGIGAVASPEHGDDDRVAESSAASPLRASKAVKPVASGRRSHAASALSVSAPPIDEPGYLLWNLALARHCLLAGEREEDAFLSITPTILAAALAAVQPGRKPPDEAGSNFVEAVSEVYHHRVLGSRQGLAVLRRCNAEGLPDCIAFLAASVLAAYRMQTDEEAGAAAYYLRLSEILRCDLVSGHPRGFDPDEFEALWHFLERWLREEKNLRLAMPGPDVGLRRFVALPLTHVPLRRVDIERLPEFFASSGYEPGARLPRERLDGDLSRWATGRSILTAAGTAALADERRVAVLAQIAHELESWDGSHADSLGRRSARVEILLDFVRRQPEVSYLPRRPAAFPAVFDDGAHVFEASDEGWYDPVQIPHDDGYAIAEGFAWEVAGGRLRHVLRRSGGSAIAMAASHDQCTGFLSHRALQLGVPGAVLCREALATDAAEYLSAISRHRCMPISSSAVPDGWCLFPGIKPVLRLDAPPTGLEALAVESAVDVIPAGGLRLGGRWAWVVGAPPRIIVAGLLPGDAVTIDGEQINVADDGVLATDGYLAHPGIHLLEAGGVTRRIEIVEPEVRNASLPSTRGGTALALPPGRWTLIGSRPGDLAQAKCWSRAGAVAFCAFTAVWAIEVGGRAGARVLCLNANNSPAPVEQFSPRRSTGVVAWSSIIYNAAIRRPRLMSLDGDEAGSEMRVAWAGYFRSARDIKRRLRKARR